jgi:maltose/maltodextrin transport system substrate-binding protein
VTTILWDYNNSYYSWGILASAGAYVFAKNGSDYDLKNMGVANRGAVEGLSKIIALIHAGVLPKSVSYSAVEDLMGQGKVAIIVSGPWAWSNLIKNGIDFAVAPIPGVDENVGRPFVGVTVAYLNRSSPNQDLIKEFMERYALTEEGLTAMYHAKPTGIPALSSIYEKLAKDNLLLRQLNAAVEYGQVMPNIPEMGGFFSSVSGALQIATQGRASAQAALQEAEATCDPINRTQTESSFCAAIRIAREQKSISLRKRAEESYAEYHGQKAGALGGRGLRPEKISVARLPVAGSDVFGREEHIAWMRHGQTRM